MIEIKKVNSKGMEIEEETNSKETSCIRGVLTMNTERDQIKTEKIDSSDCDTVEIKMLVCSKSETSTSEKEQIKTKTDLDGHDTWSTEMNEPVVCIEYKSSSSKRDQIRTEEIDISACNTQSAEMTGPAVCAENKGSSSKMDSPADKVALRERIIELRRSGKKPIEIANVLGVHYTTVYKWLKRWQEGSNLKDKYRSGAPRKTTVEDDEKIINTVQEDPGTTSVALAENLHLSVTARTVRKRLSEAKFRKCQRKK